MFKSQIKSIIVAGTVVMGALSATSGSANAEVRGSIHFGGPGISIGFGDHGHYGHRHGGYDRWDRPRYRYNRCSPRKAVRKARRKGLRRARVIRVGHRGVVVAGRKWGERVVMGFGKSKRCPVRFVRHR